MSIIINTPNGNVGRVLTNMLLDAGEHVSLLTRDADRVVGFAQRGATVYTGDLEDASFVQDASRDAEILFWATPQAYDHEDLIWFQRQLGRNAARAIEKNSIPRVVNISSLGAQHDKGTGVVKGLRAVEQALNETSADVVHLRAGFFMENFSYLLPGIMETGCAYLPVDGEVERPFIASQDIAVLCTNLLCDPEWTGTEVREIVGPKYHSFNRAAEIIGEVLERPVEHVTIEPERARKAMSRMGWSENSAELWLELYAAMKEGLIAPEETPYQCMTTLRCFARTKLAKKGVAKS